MEECPGSAVVPRLEREIAMAGGRDNEFLQMETIAHLAQVISFILMEMCKSLETHISVR